MLLQIQGNFYSLITNIGFNCKFISISYSERAENVLKSAKELIQSLDEADVAQQKAKDAIRQANEDISLARSDLEKVISFVSIYIYT